MRRSVLLTCVLAGVIALLALGPTLRRVLESDQNRDSRFPHTANTIQLVAHEEPTAQTSEETVERLPPVDNTLSVLADLPPACLSHLPGMQLLPPVAEQEAGAQSNSQSADDDPSAVEPSTGALTTSANLEAMF